MKNDKIEKLQDEILSEINSDEKIINNLKIYDASFDKIKMAKFTQNDKKYDKNFQEGLDEYMKYLITTYYLDEDYFYNIINNLNTDDFEYLIEYLKKDKSVESKDISVKVLEKKKENK